MNNFLKNVVVALLARQVRLLRKKHDFTLIGVVGGIGKTSTKLAIADVLGKTLRVRYQTGNYNDIVSVPLIFFGHVIPSLRNPFAWIRVFSNNARQIKGDYPFDVVVVELGTDRPGHIAAFQKYLTLDYAVITAIVPEHMAYFADMQAVADEELSVANYAGKLIYNADLVPSEYRQPLQHAISYGIKGQADYRLDNVRHGATGFSGEVRHNSKSLLHLTHDAISEVQLYSVLAAASIAHELGCTRAQILDGITAIQPVSGRLRQLRGANDSVIIDDTYNAIPDAVRAGLEMFYKLDAPKKIAILGSMNQIGDTSPQEHANIGERCDPAQLYLVITIGPDAKAYLAPAAAAKGCAVKSFDTPYEAGEYLRPKLTKGMLVYAKGSQDKVYAEEAIKLLLADPQDASKLVRQSEPWLRIKQQCFTTHKGSS